MAKQDYVIGIYIHHCFLGKDINVLCRKGLIENKNLFSAKHMCFGALKHTYTSYTKESNSTLEIKMQRFAYLMIKSYE